MLRRSALSRGRRIADVALRVAVWLCLIVAVVPLALVVYFVVVRGLPQWTPEFFDFAGRLTTRYQAEGGSMAPAIVGTLLTTGVAALIAIPLGVLGAIYLNEYGKNSPLARVIWMMTDVMTGVPSIVMGLFVFLAFVLLIDELNALAGALALACLMLPVVIRSSEEMLRLVPDELRQASLALGARRWRTIVSVVLPASISGIMSGALLAIARAAGETAPVVLVMGVTRRVNWSLFGGNVSLPMQIYDNAQQPYAAAQARAWGAALTLVVIVLVTTLVGRFIAARFAIRER
ncbi:MAG: phosphate ABC transporter permease PstA [Micromonosporaceae bacterium]|nr:phosphate ABC transporter permease PstA [Micromonosporaceae bacterium]